MHFCIYIYDPATSSFNTTYAQNAANEKLAEQIHKVFTPEQVLGLTDMLSLLCEQSCKDQHLYVNLGMFDTIKHHNSCIVHCWESPLQLFVLEMYFELIYHIFYCYNGISCMRYALVLTYHL